MTVFPPLLLLAIALGLSSGIAQAQEKFAGQTLRVAEFGGSWQQWLLRTIAPRFQQETGAKVEYMPGIPVQFMAQMVSAKGQTPPFDLANLSDDLAPQVTAQDLVSTAPNPALTPNLAKLPPAGWRPGGLGPGVFISAAGIVYDGDKFAQNGIAEPKDWDALTDPKLAGHVALPDITFVYRALYAAINYLKTGDQTNLDGSLALIKAIKNPVIYGDFPSLQTRFNGGEIWAVVGSSGYLLRLQQTGRNLKFATPQARDGHTGSGFAALTPIKGSGKLDLAQIYINIALSTEAQTAMVREVGFSPTNLDAIKIAAADPKLAPLTVSDPAQLDAAFNTNWTDLNKVLPEWIDKWNRTVRR
jgi:putative spermidine/putrescine transport system substrate-binding protein